MNTAIPAVQLSEIEKARLTRHYVENFYANSMVARYATEIGELDIEIGKLSSLLADARARKDRLHGDQLGATAAAERGRTLLHSLITRCLQDHSAEGEPETWKLITSSNGTVTSLQRKD